MQADDNHETEPNSQPLLDSETDPAPIDSNAPRNAEDDESTQPQHRRKWWYVSTALIAVGITIILSAGNQLGLVSLPSRQPVQAAEAEETIQIWATDTAGSSPSNTQSPSVEFPADGTLLGHMWIPRLGNDVAGAALIQGVGDADLAQGIGHFPETALPGQPGNFSVAGHRATHGEELRFIDKLQPNDLIYVKTSDSWYTYKLVVDKMVNPEDYWVVSERPLPENPELSNQTMTIVTCHPRWGSSERWIWWGVLVEQFPADRGDPIFNVNFQQTSA